jgi:hypothetical protein
LNRVKLIQWKTFLKNAALDVPHDFSEINQRVQDFLMPVCDAIHKSSDEEASWSPNKGWQ